MEIEHTKIAYDNLDGKWSIVAYKENGESYTLCTINAEEKIVKHFVKCWNNHYELLKGCKEGLVNLEYCESNHDNDSADLSVLKPIVEQLEQGIEQAEKG